MFSRSGHGPDKLAMTSGYSTYSHGRIAQCSHSSAMDWEGKVDMSEDPNMDCSENYSDVDVRIAEAKMGSDNFLLKKVTKVEVQTSDTDISEVKRRNDNFHLMKETKVEMQMPEANMNEVKRSSDNLRLKQVTELKMQTSENDIDIDKRRAAKKVLVPAETKEEGIHPLDQVLGFQHKKRPQKRTMLQTVNQPNASLVQASMNTWDHIKFKDTVDLIHKIKIGTAPREKICFTYNPKHFSDIDNLELVPNAHVSSGSFGEVLKVRDTVTGSILIQKRVKKNAKGEFELEKNEIEVPLQFSDAENIAKFFGLTWNVDELTYIMEDAGISLRQLILSTKHCSMLSQPNKIERIMLHVFSAISHLAKHGITHCDIKPENICLSVDKWLAKLVDFGSSKTRQNVMDYKGITPEYLDPLANKYLYEFYQFILKKLKNRSSEALILGEKDDVFSAGLVGLFLIKQAHPMIEFFTGSSDYPKDQAVALEKRMSVMKQISEMNDDLLCKLLNVAMSDVMGELLPGVLALDREKRLTSKMAVSFLHGKLSPDLQPPNKLSRQEEPLPYHFQVEDLSQFVDLKEKNSDKVVAQVDGKFEAPRSPDLNQTRDPEERFGIVLKGQATSTQVGQILVPAKLKGFMQQGQIRPEPHTVQHLGTPSAQQQTGHQLSQRRYTLPKVSLQEQESKDYADLVESFSEKLTPQMPRRCLPAELPQQFMSMQQHQSKEYVAQPSSPRSPERIVFPAAESGQVQFYSARVQDGQQTPSAKFLIHGLSGCVVKFAGEGGVGVCPPFEVFGNVPNIDAIEQSGDEQTRPKIKGVRRGRVSQD